jgi:CRP-like cAMP-binding protein
MDTQDLLRKTYLGRELNGEELAALAGIVSVRRPKRGEILFLENDPADGFFVLLAGRVRIYKSSPDGKEYTLHLIRSGEMFAEAAIFKGGTFPANGVAEEDSVVAFFPKDRFVRLLVEYPSISLKMIGSLSAFVREFNRQIEDLSLKEVPARLAAHLLRAAEKAGGPTFELEISKAELARSLGTISETLSRSFKKMRDQGIIQVDGGSITILDPTRLGTLAEGGKFQAF